MRRPSKSRTPRISADSQRLSALAQAIGLASSRHEERAWEHKLDTLIEKLLRIDTPIEVDYYKHGGILPFVLRQLLAA